MREPESLLEIDADRLTREAVCTALRVKYGEDATIEDDQPPDSCDVIEDYVSGAAGAVAIGLHYRDGRWFAEVEEIREASENIDDGLDLFYVETLEIVARPRGKT